WRWAEPSSCPANAPNRRSAAAAASGSSSATRRTIATCGGLRSRPVARRGCASMPKARCSGNASVATPPGARLLFHQATNDLAQAVHAAHVPREEFEADPIGIVRIADDPQDFERAFAPRRHDFHDDLFALDRRLAREQ